MSDEIKASGEPRDAKPKGSTNISETLFGPEKAASEKKPQRKKRASVPSADDGTAKGVCNDPSHKHLEYKPRKKAAAAAIAESKTPIAALEAWLDKAGQHHEKTSATGITNVAKEMEALEKQIEKAAKGGDKGAKRLLTLVQGMEEHIAHATQEHHTDAKKMAKLGETIRSLKGIVAAHAGSENPFDAIYKDAEAMFRKEEVKIPGTLIRSASLPAMDEFKAQVHDHFTRPDKNILGKGLSVVGGTVGLGVIIHGGVNIKRGLLGYQDPETGEKRGGALSNVVVGLGELAIGSSILYRNLTGRWLPGRATHAAAHDHDHDHGHGHSH